MARRRDPDRSRRAILDAAEARFAELGYDRTSMGAIAADAGVSSALPAYFFGDKAALHRAVVERCFEQREAALDPLADEVEAALAGGEPVEAALRRLVEGYLGFLHERPDFVRLIGWEALGGAHRLRAEPRHSLAVERALRALLAAHAPDVDAEQLLISLTALCFFPVEHTGTMLSAMGLDAADPAFVAARAEHVVDLLLRVVRP